MRKVLFIALVVANLGVLSTAQPTFAASALVTHPLAQVGPGKKPTGGSGTTNSGVINTGVVNTNNGGVINGGSSAVKHGNTAYGGSGGGAGAGRFNAR